MLLRAHPPSAGPEGGAAVGRYVIARHALPQCLCLTANCWLVVEKERLMHIDRHQRKRSIVSA